ncbi:MAG: methyltransferase domain-containing protein [Xylophilus ampelinus]
MSDVFPSSKVNVAQGADVPDTSPPAQSLVNNAEYAYELLQATEARTRTLEHKLQEFSTKVEIAEQRTRTLEHLCTETLYLARHKVELLQATEARTRTLEHELQELSTKVEIAEQRTRTLEYLSSEMLYLARYQADLLHKLAADRAFDCQERSSVWFQAKALVNLRTAYPIALDSNDHLQPESTSEGVVRPTAFVRHCIEKLGQGIRCLDLGTGAAGLIYEFARQQVLAIGVDGSDFNARQHVGYWPLIPDNLFTCDITQPFRFTHRTSDTIYPFNLITMWEVLEHIAEADLPQLLMNVREHLLPDGYFLGSISLLEYTDPNGTPYHITLQSREWWNEQFTRQGLIMVDEHPFNTAFFCRGVGARYQDVHNYRTHPETGFHFIAKRQA